MSIRWQDVKGLVSECDIQNVGIYTANRRPNVLTAQELDNMSWSSTVRSAHRRLAKNDCKRFISCIPEME